MTYHDLLSWLTQFNLYAWIIATIMSYWILRYTQHRGWVVVMIGSVFVVMRMAWSYMPGYQDGKSLDAMFNAYMMKFVMGSIGAVILSIGFFMLINSYIMLKTKMEDI